MKSLTVITKLVIIAFAVLILTPPAGANVLDQSDYERLNSLIENSSQLQKDIFNVERGSRNENEKDCLFDLLSTVEEVELRLSALETLVELSSDMNDDLDERIVLRELRLEAKQFTRALERRREFVNKIAGLCSWSYVVPIKAQAILAFCAQALSQVRAVLGKIDAHLEQPRTR